MSGFRFLFRVQFSGFRFQVPPSLTSLFLSDQDHPGPSLLRSGSGPEAAGLFSTPSLQDQNRYLCPPGPLGDPGPETPPDLRNQPSLPDGSPEQYPEPEEILLQTQTGPGAEGGGQRVHTGPQQTHLSPVT